MLCVIDYTKNICVFYYTVKLFFQKRKKFHVNRECALVIILLKA